MTESSFPAGFNLAVVEKTGTALSCVGWILQSRRSDHRNIERHDLRSGLADQSGLDDDARPLARTATPMASRRRRFDVAAGVSARRSHARAAAHPHLGTHPPPTVLPPGPAPRRRSVAPSTPKRPRRPRPVRSLYSDLNFMLLGWAIANCCASAHSTDSFDEVVAEPLGMRDTRYRPNRRDLRRIAATERNGDQRLTKELVWGEVHDGNAWALGGVAGHAGLFGTTDDLGPIRPARCSTRSNTACLTPASIASMTRASPVGTQPDVRGLGWRLDPAAWGPWPVGHVLAHRLHRHLAARLPVANLGVVLADQCHPSRAPARTSRGSCASPSTRTLAEARCLMEPNDTRVLGTTRHRASAP